MSQFKNEVLDRTLYKFPRLADFLGMTSPEDFLWIFSGPGTLPILKAELGEILAPNISHQCWSETPDSKTSRLIFCYQNQGEGREEILFFQRFKNKEWNFVALSLRMKKLVSVRENHAFQHVFPKDRATVEKAIPLILKSFADRNARDKTFPGFAIAS